LARLVVFGGWFGSGNIGDDAILIGLRNALNEALPGTEIVAISSDPDQTRRVCGVEAVQLLSPMSGFRGSRPPIEAYYRAFRGADACVVSGGTPIYDYEHLSRGLHFGLPRVLGKKLFCFGIGAKPIRSRTGAAFLRLLLRRAELISVRDVPSRDELLRLGVDKQVTVTGDSALFLSPDEPDTGLRKLSDCGVDTSRPMVAVCPRALSIDYRRHYHEPLSRREIVGVRRAIARVAERLVEDGREVVFVPMHRAPYDDDLSEIRAITGLMRGRPPRVVDVGMLPGEAMAVLGRMGLVFGLRLHSLIMAAAQGVPVVGVDYDPKIRGFMELVGLGNLVCGINDSDEAYFERVEWALDGGGHLGRRLARSCEDMRGKIREEARRLGALLG
jgi:polysaccharide pyruvyl transferase WcaK-like protein